MGRRLEFESLVRPPEFQQRCDNFVSEVNEIIVPKYPDLCVEPVNLTIDDLEKFPERVRRMREVLKVDEAAIDRGFLFLLNNRETVCTP